MARDLAALRVDLDGLLNDLEPVRFAMGMEGKDAAHDAIERSVGSDRAMSGFRGGRVKLGAGFDVEDTAVVINLRPKGLILLADEGRTRTTEIVPRARRRRGSRRRAALSINGTIRANAMSRPSRGNPIIDPLMDDLRRRLPPVAQEAVTAHVRKTLG